MTVASVRTRVRRGAKWLDENVPGWWTRVEVESLEMQTKCLCILGQVFQKEVPPDMPFSTGFVVGQNRLEADGFKTYSDVERLGFDSPLRNENWNPQQGYWDLKQEWLRVIASRVAKESQ